MSVLLAIDNRRAALKSPSAEDREGSGKVEKRISLFLLTPCIHLFALGFSYLDTPKPSVCAFWFHNEGEKVPRFCSQLGEKFDT